MSEITLAINDRNYAVTCDDGQEAHLRKLAEHIDERARQLAGSVGPAGEGRILVMTSLIIADELFEAYKQIHALKGGAEPGDPGTAETLNACAKRVEAIAARLGGA